MAAVVVAAGAVAAKAGVEKAEVAEGRMAAEKWGSEAALEEAWRVAEAVRAEEWEGVWAAVVEVTEATAEARVEATTAAGVALAWEVAARAEGAWAVEARATVEDQAENGVVATVEAWEAREARVAEAAATVIKGLHMPPLQPRSKNEDGTRSIPPVEESRTRRPLLGLEPWRCRMKS